MIAERVTGDLEQFLGLRYPATDITKVARDLYFEIKTRHLFNLLPANDLVLCTKTPYDIKSIDLTHCISLSISPFHIEYLRNMGSMSTQSSAIIVNDKLWGLISLHFAESRPSSLQEHQYFQTLTEKVNPLFEEVIKTEEVQILKRGEVAVGRFTDKIINDVEPFNTLVLSDVALYKVIGGQGMTLSIGPELVNVGLCPTHEEINTIIQFVDTQLDKGAHFFTELPNGIKCSNDIAGIAVYLICQSPLTCIIAYRKEINQSISWGGDPRNSSSGQATSHRYSPRKSFEQWIEVVDGQCAPWSTTQIRSLDKLIHSLCFHLEVKEDELSILLKNGMRRAVKRRETIRNSAAEFINSISSGIAIGIEIGAKKDSQILAINNVAAESFNVSLSELIGTSFNTFMESLGLSEIDQSQIGKTFTISTANNGVREVEFRQGILFDYINTDKLSDSGVKLIVYEFKDITEAIRIKNSLIAARDRAISENKLRNDMIAKLSHELKTPLHGLIGLADILKLRFNRGDLSSKDQEVVETLQQSAYLMKEVIDYTLKNSTLIDTIDDKNFVLINTTNLLNDIKMLVEPLASKQDVDITIDSEDCNIYAEPRGIRQVLINIIENAIKYNIQHGKVMIDCRTTKFDQVQITVKDTGVGMSENDLKRCLEPYQRFSNKDGSGLGLPIAESLIRAMGGHLDISSTLGIGTMMKITLSQSENHS